MRKNKNWLNTNFSKVLNWVKANKKKILIGIGMTAIVLAPISLIIPAVLAGGIGLTIGIALVSIFASIAVSSLTVALTHKFEKPAFRAKEDSDEVGIEFIKNKMKKVEMNIAETIDSKTLTGNKEIAIKNKLINREVKSINTVIKEIEGKLAKDIMSKKEKD